MKIISLLLSLMLALGAPLQLTLTARESAAMSPGAVEALNALLGDAALTLSAEEYALTYAGEPRLLARAGEGIACGEAAAPLEIQAGGHGDVFRAARELGELLAPWEEQTAQNVDLQEAGMARTVYVYALTGEEWAQVMPGVMAILTACAPEAAALENAEIVGKGTFKRYFDKDMNELGAYFYAQEAHLDQEAREVRLEYARAAGKGFFIALRCPNARQTRNVRIALHGKEREGAWARSGDVRIVMGKESEIFGVSGRTGGTLTLTLSRKGGEDSGEYALALARSDAGAEYAFTRNKHLVLKGEACWQAAEAPEFTLPAINTDMDGVAAALAGRLICALREAAPDTWQQLLHAVSTQTLIDAQKNGHGEDKEQ